MRHEGVETRVFREPEDVVAAVSGVTIRIVPLKAGPFAVSLRTFHLGRVVLQVGHSTPFLGFAAAGPGSAILQLPLEHADSLVLNGVMGGPRILGAYGEGAELLRSSPRDCHHSVITLPSEFVEPLLEPPVGSKLFRPGSHALMQAAPTAWVRAAGIIRAAEAAAAASPETFDDEQPRHALRESLLCAAHELVALTGEDTPIRVPHSSRVRRRIVAAADEYLRAHVDRPIYTEGLCDALGVSASALAEAFRAVFVVSPHRFLKLRRLGMVRAALRSREGPPPLVKSAALSHGFWHLGQFAHDYRATFGESPSETLARARGPAAVQGKAPS